MPIDPENVSSLEDMGVATEAYIAKAEAGESEPDPKPPEQPPLPGKEAPPQVPATDPDGEAEPTPVEDPAATPDPEAEEEAEVELDGEKLTKTELRALLAESKARATADKERDRVRLEERLALLEKERAGKQEDAPPPLINPIDEPHKWAHARENQWERFLQERGQAVDWNQIRSRVMGELQNAQQQEERRRITVMRQEIEQERAAASAEREARTIASQLDPLYRKYPHAATPDGRQEVQARLLLAAKTGGDVNYEAVVKQIHDREASRDMRAVRNYLNKKKVLASATAPAATRVGSAAAPRSKADELPATLESLTVLGELAANGKV